MPQDAFTLSYTVKELSAALTGGKISRIIQPSREELTFIIYTAKGNVKLDACLSARSARLSLGESDKPVPKVAPNFCMLLRKHLQNAQITGVAQHGFERIIYLDLNCVSDFSSSKMRLYFEIMGKYSNAVLTENGVIVGALKTNSIGENTKRLTLGGAKYTLPEPQDKASPDNLSELESVLKIGGDRVKLISEHIKGIAFATAAEMVNVYGENITAQNIYDYVFNCEISPCVTYTDGEPSDFKVRSTEKDKKVYPTLLQAQSAYYDYIYKKRAFESAKTKLESALSGAVKKVEKRLALIGQKLLECNGADAIKLKGELITANMYALERGMKSFEAINYYDPECKKIKIALDETLTPSQNAQKYYKKYQKLKRTYLSVTAQKSEAEQRLDYLESISAHLSSAESEEDLKETQEELISLGLIKAEQTKKRKEDAPSYREFSFGGFKILAGRNNLQNERLTKSLAPDDLWLHTQKYHSSHVAVIAEGREVDNEVIKVAAEICAYYSDGRSGSKIPVDFTQKKHVKKPPATNAGFVIYTDYNTVLVDPDGHAELLKEQK